MNRALFILLVAALIIPLIVMAQTNKTVQEYVMSDGKNLTFESTEGKTITKEEAIKSYEAQKELDAKLGQQKITRYGTCQ